MNEESVTRLNCEIPDSVNEQLNRLIPHGSKSNVIRKLVELYIEANKSYGREFVIKLLDGKAQLVIRTDGT